MSKKSQKTERKKKKRQERIRQEKHQRHLTPAVPSFWDNDVPVRKDPRRSMDVERWLRGHAQRTGQLVVGMPELAQALNASMSNPMVGSGALAGAPAVERAQELAFQSIETNDADEAAILARAALEIDATNLDARRTLIIHEAAGDPDACYRRLLDLLDEAGSTLDQALVTETEGRLSRLLNGRPFLRVLQSLMFEAAKQHDLERLAPVMKSYVHFDQASCWVVIGHVLKLLNQDERWDCAARLRDLVIADDVGRFMLDGLLALRAGDRRAAGDLIRQAHVRNPILRQFLRGADNSPIFDQWRYEAAAIVNGLEPLIDDLPDFPDWLADGMPWMDQATIDRALKAYGKPLSNLLDLGHSAIDEIDYVQKYGIGPQHREPLEQMLKDPVFQQVGPTDREAFAPMHAWRALGQIGDQRSLPVLFSVLLDPDVSAWDYDELPKIIGSFAAAALPSTLQEHRVRLADPEGDETLLWALQLILALIAKRDPESRGAVIDCLRAVVTDPQMHLITTRASAIASLSELRAVECLPAIEQAYADGMVDIGYIGLSSVREKMALGEVDG
jgi:tetratricopeptide (TPR) repeat protein